MWVEQAAHEHAIANDLLFDDDSQRFEYSHKEWELSQNATHSHDDKSVNSNY